MNMPRCIYIYYKLLYTLECCCVLVLGAETAHEDELGDLVVVHAVL